MNVLREADLDAFVERGFCVLRGAFDARRAPAARARVWRRMEEKAGIREDDPATWPGAYDIEERLAVPEVLDCFTDRLAAAIEELVGPDAGGACANGASGRSTSPTAPGFRMPSPTRGGTSTATGSGTRSTLRTRVCC